MALRAPYLAEIDQGGTCGHSGTNDLKFRIPDTGRNLMRHKGIQFAGCECYFGAGTKAVAIDQVQLSPGRSVILNAGERQRCQGGGDETRLQTRLHTLIDVRSALAVSFL